MASAASERCRWSPAASALNNSYHPPASRRQPNVPQPGSCRRIDQPSRSWRPARGRQLPHPRRASPETPNESSSVCPIRSASADVRDNPQARGLPARSGYSFLFMDTQRGNWLNLRLALVMEPRSIAAKPLTIMSPAIARSAAVQPTVLFPGRRAQAFALLLWRQLPRRALAKWQRGKCR